MSPFMSPPSSFQLVPHIVHNKAAFHAQFNGQKISGSSTTSRHSSLYAKKRKRKNSYNDDYNDDDDIALEGLTEEEEVSEHTNCTRRPTEHCDDV